VRIGCAFATEDERARLHEITPHAHIAADGAGSGDAAAPQPQGW